MDRKKIKIEPGNDLERRTDALERIQGLVKFDRLEIEKKLIEHQKQNEKIKDVRVKTEERTICAENQTLITDLNNKVVELKIQVLEKVRVVGAYQNRLRDFETKVAEMEKEIGELKEHKWMDNQNMEELRIKLSESELRERKLKENNSEASKTVEELSRRILACEDEKKNCDRILEEMRRKESESVRFVDELRRQNLEAEHANEIMARELFKANSSVKELKERNLEAYKASEVHMKRFVNLVPIAEDLTNLLKMNVEDLEKLKNKFVGDVCVSSPSVERGFNGLPGKGPHASKALDFRISTCKQSTKTRSSTEIIEIIDCEDETEMICEQYVSNPSLNKRNERNGIDCSEFSPIIPKGKRSKLGVGAKNSPVNRKWTFRADMLRALEEDDELCMHAVCALYRQQVLASESTKCSRRVLYHFEAMRGHGLAEFLIDGDPQLRLTKSVGEVKQRFPDVVNQCRRLAIDYSWYFIAMPRIPSLYKVKPLSLSFSSLLCV